MYIDLSQLVGRKRFTVSCILSKNRYSTYISTLIDSRANGLVFIDSKFAYELAEYLHTLILRLKRPCVVKGYDGKLGAPAREYIRVQLTVDSNRQLDIPILILELGTHDLILGREWLSHFDIWLDVRNRRLVWPKEQIREAGPLIH